MVSIQVFVTLILCALHTLFELTSAQCSDVLIPQYGDSWYKYHLGPLEWDDARRMCNGEGGYLAIVNSPGEAEFLQTLMNYYPFSCITDADKVEAFIGIHDYFQAGRYVTIDGRNIEKSGYQYWNDGEPNSIGDERCGAIYRSNGRLNNLRCHDKHTYICEYKRPPGGVVVLG